MLSTNSELILLLIFLCYRRGNYSIERLLLAHKVTELGTAGIWTQAPDPRSNSSCTLPPLASAPTDRELVRPGPAWSLDTLATILWGPAGLLGPWAVTPKPDAEIRSCQLPPFAMVLLNRALLFLQSHPGCPTGMCGSPTCMSSLWGPGPTCGWPFWMAVSTNGMPLFLDHIGLVLVKYI